MSQSKTGSRNARGAAAALALALALVLGLVAPAAADAPRPQITRPPVVSGTAQVGQTVTATGAEWRDADRVDWRWYRCEGTSDTGNGGDGDDDDERSFRGCEIIGGATSTAYTVTPADEGRYLRVLLVVSNEDGYRWRLSAASARVTAAPPPPPAPTPTPEPEPLTTGGTAPVPAPPAPTGGVRAETVTRPATLMRPVPLVRIRGRTTLRGARITLLTVTAPKGARITLACRGRGCPVRRWARTAATTRILRFERRLRAGTRLIIRVTKRGHIGKHTTILIRRNRAPLRSDRCLYPGRSRPASCPAA